LLLPNQVAAEIARVEAVAREGPERVPFKIVHAERPLNIRDLHGSEVARTGNGVLVVGGRVPAVGMLFSKVCPGFCSGERSFKLPNLVRRRARIPVVAIPKRTVPSLGFVVFA